jgi:phenylalanine-4-hydroxylase
MIHPKPETHAGGITHLVHLDQEHPGFRDPAYRARRDAIARLALEYQPGSAVPDVPYSEEEHDVWRQIWETLAPLHAARTCQAIRDLESSFPLDRQRIPQLSELNRRLVKASGYRMEPVAGLVDARTFLCYLGHGAFLSTQYIRHASRPFYTPEPDVVHELVGHAATLAHPGIAELNRLFGEATDVADEPEMQRLANLYWYTIEFGVVEEGGQPKAFGAGLLSSCGELASFSETAELRAWDPDRIATTAFDPTSYQPQLYVAPSFDRMLGDVRAWVEAGRWRSTA